MASQENPLSFPEAIASFGKQMEKLNAAVPEMMALHKASQQALIGPQHPSPATSNEADASDLS